MKYFVCISLLYLVSCSIEKKLIKERTKLGIYEHYVYIRKDSIRNNNIYFFDRKNQDSIKLSSDFAPVNLYMSQTEISNKEYNFFLNYLLENNMNEKYQLCMPKCEKWLPKDSTNTFFMELHNNYHSNDNYSIYPIVNISYLAMKEYVNWLNEVEPSKNIFYSLPTTEEWEFAFNCDTTDSNQFSWGGPNYRNFNNRKLANFAEINNMQLRYDRLKDSTWFNNFNKEGLNMIIDGPLPVYQFLPNCFGLYQMSGNVAEITDILPNTNLSVDNIFFTKGGSWFSSLYYLTKYSTEMFKLPSPCVGFRVVRKELIKPK